MHSPSALHTLHSRQTRAAPGLQLPAMQTSSSVHGSPSSHRVPSDTVENPQAPPVHVSLVQGLPSSGHTRGVPAQTLPVQVSPVVHPSPSSHEAVVGEKTQAPAVHASEVHGL